MANAFIRRYLRLCYMEKIGHDIEYVSISSSRHQGRCSRYCNYIMSPERHSKQYTEKNSSQHEITCSSCNYFNIANHSTYLASNSNGHWEACSLCDWDEPGYTPHTEEWRYVDETTHEKVCTTCGYQSTTGEHSWTPNDEFNTHYCEICNSTSSCALIPHKVAFAGLGHGYVCAYCGQRMTLESHDYGDLILYKPGDPRPMDCIGYKICKTCGYQTLVPKD